MNPLILSIETSAEICSVAISKGLELIAEQVITEPRQQAGQLAPVIEKILNENNLTIANIDAVAVSEGPGSYTGLRVGASTAKGICFGTQKPLIAVNTMNILFDQALKSNNEVDFIIPAIDARRMEIYQTTYTKDGSQIAPIEPKIIDSSSYSDILIKGRVLFIGNGAEKMSTVITNKNASFLQCQPYASSMINSAYQSYITSDFKDVAYFEPFYLKDFVAGIAKKDPLKW